MKAFHVYFFAASAVLTAGCSREVERSELPGTYTLCAEGCVGTIKINENGSYRHVVKAADGLAMVEQEGTWTFDSGKRPPLVMFHGFVLASQLESPGPGAMRGLPMIVAVQAERRRGTIKLALDYDLKLYYLRQEKPR